MMADEQNIQAKTDKFPCPSCGAEMAFDPDTQSLKCAFCSSKKSIENAQGEIQEYDFATADDTKPQNWGTEKKVIRCDNCGAETVLDATDASKFCAFCGSSKILQNDQSAGIPPESLVSFKISQAKSTEIFSEWVKKRFFAPNQLKSSHQLQKITGVYVPCWTYDADTSSSYTAEAGTYYYEKETHYVTENGQQKAVTEEVRKTRWNNVSGNYSQSFNDILVNASRKINEELMDRLEPFNLPELVHYKPEFLSGFQAERYSIGLKEGWQTSKKLIDETLETNIEKEINADEVRNLNIHTRYQNIKYKHILLPVWVASYTYQNKVFQFMINGQTGKIQGKAPISGWKVVWVSLLSLIGVGIISLFSGGLGLILLPVAAIIIVISVNASCR
jgi:predicted RNA-binding Zn-ribbon protein involved in translation (DUF1610 family)